MKEGQQTGHLPAVQIAETYMDRAYFVVCVCVCVCVCVITQLLITHLKSSAPVAGKCSSTSAAAACPHSRGVKASPGGISALTTVGAAPGNAVMSGLSPCCAHRVLSSSETGKGGNAACSRVKEGLTCAPAKQGQTPPLLHPCSAPVLSACRCLHRWRCTFSAVVLEACWARTSQ